MQVFPFWMCRMSMSVLLAWKFWPCLCHCVTLPQSWEKGTEAFKDRARHSRCERYYSGFTAALHFREIPFGANSKLTYINKWVVFIIAKETSLSVLKMFLVLLSVCTLLACMMWEPEAWWVLRTQMLSLALDSKPTRNSGSMSLREKHGSKQKTKKESKERS